ncbi:hypothetical protein BKI52_20275 [marine bacterium AO1-C]|nr:hypothetical protein BKI52_20275 [marine bacterium AO1-C]
MNILILEDEIPAYKKLNHCLTQCLGTGFSHTLARSVEEGINALNACDSFDLIFSDIKLLDGTAFEIFDSVNSAVPIIFCTAYDEHLLQAFKTNGIEYILKPFSQSHIENALTKYKTLFSAKAIDKNILDDLRVLFTEKQKKYKRKFVIKKQNGILLIETNEIAYIEAFGELSKLIDTGGNVYIKSTNIGKLTTDLDPDQFFRVNRSQVINIDHVIKIAPHTKNRLSILMKGQKSTILTSSSTTKDFRKWLGI